jgi:ribosomal protein S18 acetylase RimI-like enzyme
MRLVRWTAQDLANRMDEVLAVFGEAMSYDKQALEVRRGYINTHLKRSGFHAVATLTDTGELSGFGYGYRGGHGQWWHDHVRSALAETHRQRWLTSCFEIVEMHVRPSAQGRGRGEVQLRSLLSMTSEGTALLSTPEVNDEAASRAWRLYRRTGFVDVVRQLMFPGDPRPFAVLGRDLPMPEPSG